MGLRFVLQQDMLLKRGTGKVALDVGMHTPKSPPEQKLVCVTVWLEGCGVAGGVPHAGGLA
jgi:hypothetical protein